MALRESDLSELLDALRAGGDIDVIRRSVELVLQALIEAEATGVIGAEPHERSDARTNQRNGHRPRLLSTKAGDLELAIPKLRRGSSSPRSSNDAGASTGPCSRWSWRPTCTACPPARWMAWSRPWAWGRASPRARSAASAPSSTGTWRTSAPGHSAMRPSPTCSVTPPTSRPGCGAGWSRGRWW